MRNRFDEQLEMLNVELMRMGMLCEKIITHTLKLLEGQSGLEEAVRLAEQEIDHQEQVIEQLCLRLLLQQQPVAKDLRLISAALKMISDMERIGDQALDIVEIAVYIKQEQMEQAVNLKEMARRVIQMVTESVDAFIKRDLDLARKVINDDDIVDQIFVRIKKDLVKEIRGEHENCEYCLDLLMIAKYFERIGDHATNIAEWAEFSISGIHAGD